MKAAVLKEFGAPLVMEERPIPVPGPGQVRVKVKASGLCVSDLHIQDGIISTVKVPYVPGHELAGVIDALGEGVDQVKAGDHVTAAIDITCGSCRFCLSGKTNLCEKLVRIGFERDGSHEEYVCIPAENAFKVADHIPFEQVTGLPDAVGCMYNAVKNRAQVRPGDRVLILGAGGLGMNAIQLVKLFGAQAYATTRNPEKIKICREMGADAAINTKEEDLHEAILRLTGGEMCDAVIDNIGIESSINEALSLVRRGGRVIVTGYNDPAFHADYQDVMKFEKEILGVRGMSKADLKEVISLVEQGLITPYVYRVMPFAQINEALEMMRRGEALGRIVLTME